MSRADLAERRIGLVGSKADAYFRARALQITGDLEDDIVSRAQQVLLTALKQDKTERQVLSELDAALGDWLPERDSADRIVNVPARIETIARTNLSEAINEGRYAAFTDPELQGFVTAFQYSAVLDDRTRETHAAWDGVTRPVDDAVWYGPPDERPPNGFNCRCILVPVTAADDTEMTPDDELPSEPAADVSFK